MIPDVLAIDASPSVPIRNYLDRGGRVVWIGDIPFWRQGKCFPNLSRLSIEQIAKKHDLSLISLKLYPNKDPFDAGIIEIHFPNTTIISNQSGDYICHRGVRDKLGDTQVHTCVLEGSSIFEYLNTGR